MNLPSIKTLSQVFGNAKRAREILEGVNLSESPAVQALRKASYNPQPKFLIKLTALSELGNFYGVESIESEDGEYAEYVNTGDVYNMTVIYWRGRYGVQCLGDFIERNKVKFL